ncbi:spore coat protein YsxE [Neobacillus notoginsengisoli]|uniref:Spore coat protein YsxE n=1 Tax=Neobacillus notoginsengisoli TaxID=1578198 RepID=A0A417YU02_9BACI|nr:spore coat protein YsxE [Neobacillus notoginsengisoli]RHW40653.1 spore coat protein YsxE [Neobacillus notoginsengisoli]
MNETNRLKEFAHILQPYGIQPYFIEDFGKIKKVYSNKGTFALKAIDAHTGMDFIRHVQYLYQRGYNRIVPIYPALDGRYGILDGQNLYYLMPWLGNEAKEGMTDRNKQMVRELARLHTLSAKEVKVGKEDRQEHFDKMGLQYEKNREFMDGFIESCEKKTYMSPVELQFCLYYSEISQALKFSKERLETWLEKSKDLEKARMVVIHGKLSPDHFLYNEAGHGYFINFEQAGYGSPTHDLLPFMSRMLETRPKRSEEAVDWVTHYFHYFPFKPDEKQLFYSYLSHPLQIIRIAEAYFGKKGLKNEFKYSRKLLKEYWHLKNTEYVVMRLTEIEQQQEAAKEGAQ